MLKKKTGSSRYFFYFIFSTGIIVAAYFGVKSLIIKMDMFYINKIEISGNINLESEFLQNLSRDFLGQNLYAVSKKDVLQKYENIVRIDDIKVIKVFPDELRIMVKEKRGTFYLKSKEGELFPIDRNRIVLDNKNFYEHEIIPVIETEIPSDNFLFGEKIENDFVERVFTFYGRLIKTDPEFSNHISEFYEDDGDIIMVETNVGYRIIFGDDEVEEKLKRYVFLEQNRTFEKGTIVDLRFKNQLVIRSEDQ
jgi:cell division septal protein FtsQ